MARPKQWKVLAIGAALYGLAVVASSLRPGSATWGIDAPGYLPLPWRVLTLAMVVAGVALLGAAAFFPTTERKARGERRRDGRASRLWILVPLLGALALWLLRARSHLLGDQEVWIDNVHANKYPLYSEPLAALAWRGYALALRALGVPPTDAWLALLPVLCGLLAGALAWLLSDHLARDRATRSLALGLLASLGAIQLYCGYLESYAVVGLAMLLFLLMGMRSARSRTSLLLASAALVLAVATHLALLVLVPAYVLLVLSSGQSPARRVGIALVTLGVMVGAVWGLERGAGLFRPFEVLRVALVGSDVGQGVSSSLAARAGDFLNAIFLVMPVPALLLGSMAFSSTPRTWIETTEHRFLLVAAASSLLLVGILVLPGSPAQDWDLLAVALLPVALLGIMVGSGPTRGVTPEATAGVTRQFRAGLILLALGPVLAFVLVNANEEAGLRRFKSLLDPAVRLSPHERAYGNEKVMKYYAATAQAESTLVYAQKALASEPANPRYHANVGSALYNAHRYAEATPYFEEALRGGLARPEVHYQLGLCYMRARRFAEALGEFRSAASAEAKPEYLHNLAMAMLATGDGRGAYSLLISILQQWPEYEPSTRALEHYFGGQGQPGP